MGEAKPDYDLFAHHFSQAVSQTGVAVPRRVFRPFFAHWALVCHWNARINLTGITDLKEVVARHYVDSLALLPALKGAGCLMDVGTGAGFPGVVIAITCPDLKVHLVESVQKKVHFLREVRRSLALTNVEIHPNRVEKLDPALRCDRVTGRAAADPATFAALVRNRLAPDGRLAMFVTGDEAPVLPAFSPERTFAYRLPFTGQKRAVVLYGVTDETPA